MSFETAVEMVQTILDPSTIQLAVRNHECCEHCGPGCDRFYVAIDFAGEAVESAGTDLDAQFIHPESVQAISHMCNLDRQKFESAYRRDVTEAWRWAGRPETFIHHFRLAFVNRGRPLALSVVADASMDYTDTEGYAMVEATSAPLAPWTDADVEKTEAAVMGLIADAISQPRLMIWRITLHYDVVTNHELLQLIRSVLAGPEATA